VHKTKTMAEFLPFLFLLSGLLIGGLCAWLIAKMWFTQNRLTEEEIQARFVQKEVHEQLQNQADILQDDLREKDTANRQLSEQLAVAKKELEHFGEKLESQQQQFQALQTQAKTEFENIANRLLEEKSQKFSLHNQEKIEAILQPLREKIREFEDGVEKKFIEETKQRFSLQQEIENLQELNAQLSSDANNLVNALKGDSKMQGDWGELQLELLLQKAGLQRGVHYRAQESFRDVHGQQKRPDFIINLPGDKHLILDAKVSLTAYERYFNTETDAERQQHLRAHLESVYNHIKALSAKNYPQIYEVHSPDYVLLFIPIEPAFLMATQADSQLFVKALENNIVIVSPSTLLATLRTIASIWKQENQKQHVLEIVRQSGLLYDKFCGFVEDLQGVGQRLEQAQTAYSSAMNKLKDSPHRGSTLIGKVERLKELGADTSKSLPKELLSDFPENGEEE